MFITWVSFKCVCIVRAIPDKCSKLKNGFHGVTI